MRKTKTLVLLMLLLVVLGFIFYLLDTYFASPREVQMYMQGLGAWGGLAAVLLITLEVILAPVPGAVFAIGTGAAFGPWWGFVYTYSGNVIGTVLVFSLARFYGRPVAQRLIREEKLLYYDRFFREHGRYGLWVVYMLPIFPSDILSIVTGLSNLRFRTFLKIILVGFVPNMLILSFFGNYILVSGFSLGGILVSVLILAAVMLGFAIVYTRIKSRRKIKIFK